MKRDPSITQSVWMREQLPQFPTLNHDLEVDVVIVGAGLTGITAAYLPGPLGRGGSDVGLSLPRIAVSS
jgi:ribulose 1,5-bisphosphate synthetase/thiazole synthase